MTSLWHVHHSYYYMDRESKHRFSPIFAWFLVWCYIKNLSFKINFSQLLSKPILRYGVWGWIVHLSGTYFKQWFGLSRDQSRNKRAVMESWFIFHTGQGEKKVKHTALHGKKRNTCRTVSQTFIFPVLNHVINSDV